jgi:hypothetical protein
MKTAIPVYASQGRQRSGVGVAAGPRGASMRPPAYGIQAVDGGQVQAWDMPPGVQAHDGGRLQRAAQLGISGSGGPLPHLPALRRAFGKHDVSGVVAHSDGLAAGGAAALGTIAYARGEHVAFAGPPSLRVAAHEAAHVVQQRAGVQLPQGFGRAGDVHERMADAVADRVVAGRSAEDLLDRAGPPAQPRADASAPVQCYTAIGSNKLYAQMPNKRPRFGYPYAVVDAGDFIAQEKALGVDGVDSFLTAQGGNTANLVAAGNGLGLRISDDAEMAIEASDLVDRQPKVFFATQAVVTASNLTLQNVGSPFTLQIDNATTITILTDRHSQKTLSAVTPQYNGGSPDDAPQNCNAMAGQVLHVDPIRLGAHGSDKALNKAKLLAPKAAGRYKTAWDDNSIKNLDPYENDIAREYVRKGKKKSSALEREGVNRYAAPEVGETYMINSLGKGTSQNDGSELVRDYSTKQDKRLAWSYHFGGVVARSGDDRITLENYARGDNRQDNADPRWYFQMYGMRKGQSFHDQHKATGGYANALTVSLDRDD